MEIEDITFVTSELNKRTVFVVDDYYVISHQRIPADMKW